MKLTILDTGLSRTDPYVIVDENEKVLAASYEQNGEHSKTGLLRLTNEITTLRAQLAEASRAVNEAADIFQFVANEDMQIMENGYQAEEMAGHWISKYSKLVITV